uniref:RNase H type-1 domain-containing protein n=1 Tax=Bubo bubo TaxID=30461 RepID=A0A8C0IJI4_BUBBB
MTVLVSHTVSAVLEAKGGHRLSPQRFLKYQAAMVEEDDVEIVVTNIVNPASFLSGNTGEPVQHDCLETIEATYSSRTDLRDSPMENTENWLTDGSSYVLSGKRHAGYAVTSSQEMIESGHLPMNTSAQKAEIIALTRALELAQGKAVNIYTDSKYAFGVVHARGAIWKERGLLNSQGKNIRHAEEILRLLEAVQLPKKVAIMHIKAHQKVNSDLEKGNELADREAKRAAKGECLPQKWWGECTAGTLLPLSYPIRNLQGVSQTLWYQVKQKREVENPLAIRGTRLHSFLRWLIPRLGVSELEKAIVNISATVEILANATADAIVNLQKEINSLAEVTIQNRMALDLLMAKEGGVCTVINQSCCAFVNREAQIETDVHRIWEASKLFHLRAQDDTSWGFTNLWEKLTSWLPNFAWLKQLFVLVVTLLILGLLTCILIKRCFWCCQNTGDAYVTWKKNQLRHRLESNKYFSEALDQWQECSHCTQRFLR